MENNKSTRQKPRTCVACHTEAPKRALIRIVRGPDGVAVLDVTGKLPGRGAYICLNPECLAKAKKTGALERALKTKLTDECYADLARCIENYAELRGPEERMKELRSLIGLSRRAGLVKIGMDAIKSESRHPLLILSARDRSESVTKFADDFIKNASENKKSKHEHCTLPFSIEELSSALGSGKVQIIALDLKGGLADKIKILIK